SNHPDRLVGSDTAGDPDDDVQHWRRHRAIVADIGPLRHFDGLSAGTLSERERNYSARGLMTSLSSLISCSATESGLSSIVESTSGPTLSKRLPSWRSA